ncbi:hypothetical protein G3I55_17700, partial [Streptomyces sp. SID6648]|nr:hypothetical protein [Streptomyces sp. SID6648]
VAAYEQQLREQTVAAREAEPEYDLDQAPELDWAVEGETFEERPEQAEAVEADAEESVEEELQPEQAPELEAPAVTGPTAEDQMREAYERQYVEDSLKAEQARAAAAAPEAEAEQAPQTEQLPAHLADLQEELDKAHGALTEIANRMAESNRAAAEADEAVRAEQAEVSRSREAEAQVAPQIQQDQ